MSASSQGEACLKLFKKEFDVVKPKCFHQEDRELFEQEMETYFLIQERNIPLPNT